MKLTSPIEHILLGGRIRYLAGSSEGSRVNGENYIYENMIQLKEDLEKLDLAVSRNLYKIRLQPIEDELSNQVEDENGETSLSKEQSKKLTKAIIEFENTVFAEAETRIIAHPVPRRFALDHLLHAPGEILGRGVFDQLSDLAQSDLSFACRCIAFECPTAAAFHILRCVEECIRMLYKSYFPRGDELRPWGILTSEIKQKERKPKPEEILIAHLDHIRKRFRNPTDHPEKIYEIEESEDLVHLAVDIINRCIRDPQMQKRFNNS